MAAIAQHHLQPTAIDPWRDIASAAEGWAFQQDLSLRDVIVLVPFAQLLPWARRAFGAGGGWMPRIETTQSLGRSLGPAELTSPDQLSFDRGADSLRADRMLRAQAWGAAWAGSDPRAFAQAALQVVETAHALAQGAFALPPGPRAAHWDRARALLGLQAVTPGSPGARERLLCRIALEWAATAPAPATDGLFDLHPAGWIVLQAGGEEPLSRRLLDHASVHTPCLWLDCDVDPVDPFSTISPGIAIEFATCDDFESEAQRSAACILRHLNGAVQPVALIAQDRLLVRRIRALLARQGVSIRDETGWKLSTTRAAASLRSAIDCATDGASTDDWLDWLKACPSTSAAARAPNTRAVHALDAVDALEKALRAAKIGRAQAIDLAGLPVAAASLWQAAQSALRPLLGAGRPLAAWLDALEAVLRATRQMQALEADDAGRQLLSAIRQAAGPNAASNGTEPMALTEFAAWLDIVLEQASFLPEPDAAAQVVVTPLSRAVLRPFAAVVFPGTDERNLGTQGTPAGLLSDAELHSLGMPDRQSRRDNELRSFAHVLRQPRLTLLQRTAEAGEPLAPSPLTMLLGLALRRHRPEPWVTAGDDRTTRTLEPTPMQRPQPSAPSLLPPRLSASACEALRACPYRFFALRMLKLSPADELDADLEKREYGTWLHAVLQRFHAERAEPLPAPDEASRLHQIAQLELRGQRIDEAEFLPFTATFARLVPRYIAWLHQRDADGAQWLDAELTLTAHPAPWGGVEMKGVIDRVDYAPADRKPVTQLIDYKTGQAAALRDAVKRGEDTQLPFYAALMAAQGDAPGDIEAMYLMLDESEKIIEIAHRDVQASADALVAGMGRELARIAAGAALPALGEGRACDFCDARGLCRRDHWPADAASAA